jgi:hypothetical protein
MVVAVVAEGRSDAGDTSIEGNGVRDSGIVKARIIVGFTIGV